MRKKKKKEFSLLMPTIYFSILLVITTIVYFTKVANKEYEKIGLDNITYVSNSILNRSIPVVNISDVLKSPVVENIPIVRFFYDSNSDLSKKEKYIVYYEGRYYYNKDDENEMKEQSIVYYEGTYMPNTGIDYANSEVFDVFAMYDGTVIDINDDELLGKTVKIKHNNELISVYQGIDNIEIKVGDIVFTGSKIATSGKSKINSGLGESLHFEIYKSGVSINPENVINHKISDI